MPTRRIIRIVVCVAIIALLWMRTAREGGAWLFGSIALTVLLLLVIVMEIVAAGRMYRRPQDDVPKHPLGLS